MKPEGRGQREVVRREGHTESCLLLLGHHLPQLFADLGDHRLDLLVHGSLWRTVVGQQKTGKRERVYQGLLGLRGGGLGLVR
jgi:hypothetical protein